MSADSSALQPSPRQLFAYALTRASMPADSGEKVASPAEMTAQRAEELWRRQGEPAVSRRVGAHQRC